MQHPTVGGCGSADRFTGAGEGYDGTKQGAPLVNGAFLKRVHSLARFIAPIARLMTARRWAADCTRVHYCTRNSSTEIMGSKLCFEGGLFNKVLLFSI